jgi:2-hydroxychromene-2-carboxylate isomerase
MWRDMEREAARLGLPFRKPDPFPQNALAAARVALVGADHPWGATFTKAVFRREFGEGRSIAEAGTIHAILLELGIDAESVTRLATAEANKTRLKALTEEARSRGIFGAPTFFTEDGEMFWGNDRLEQAVAWAAGER